MQGRESQAAASKDLSHSFNSRNHIAGPETTKLQPPKNQVAAPVQVIEHASEEDVDEAD